jgi:proline racemase
MGHVLTTIDAHVAGEPLRLITGGLPRLVGKTMAQKRDWMKRHADHLRRAVVLEPRGHRDMCAACLTEPVSPGSDAGVVFLQHDGYSAIAGHAVMAIATIALERGLFFSREATSDARLTFDTVAGTVYAHARVQSRGGRCRVDSVAFTNVPSFVLRGGHAVRIGSRDLRVDLAFGGVFYAIVDTEAVGVPLTAARLPDLRRLGAEIRAALNATGAASHPAESGSSGVEGVIFTGPAHDPEAHLRNITIIGDGAADRSPCATGTSAVMAVLDAMGLLEEGRPFVHEGVLGTLHRGRVVGRTQVGELPAIVTEIEGTAWVTGDHTFHVDDDDPLKDGYAI